jgi:hypothetical protein
MDISRGRRRICLFLAGLLAGCSDHSTAVPDSGAKEKATSYFEALIKRDWQKAYSALDPASRTRVTQDQFARLAKSYRDLDFEPAAVKLRACEEHADEAIAHVVLVGKTAGRDRRYRDSVALRRTAKAWGVILPTDFGRTRMQ